MENMQNHVRVIVQHPSGKVLMMRRSAANKRAVGSWELPGGKTDGENPDVAACRELLEESGIEVAVKDLELVGDVVERVEKTVFFHTAVYCVAPKKYAVKLSIEHDDWCWKNINDLQHIPLARNSNKIIQEVLLQKITD